jgi:two-component system, LytTR family, sensor kinase
MKLKMLPYVVILFFTMVISVVRYFLIPEWTIGIHLMVFCIQFIFLTFIWKLVEYLSNYLDKYVPFDKNVGKRIMLQLLLSILIIAPFFLTIIYFAKTILPPYATPQFLTLLGIIFVMFISLINFISYFKYFFIKWENSVLSNAALTVTAAELEKEKSMMRYHHLKNQVNPHFLFNTFSSLDGLVQSNPELASEFIRHMSKVYRYVLEHKENEVVSIETELNFIQHYISLLDIRYEDAIHIRVDISDAAKEKGIVMVTLQMLIDNAIKHNIVQTNMPLHIEIWDEEDYLHIHNNKQLRRQIETSNGQGLKQLKELYAYLTGKPVKINETESAFEINLPLL